MSISASETALSITVPQNKAHHDYKHVWNYKLCKWKGIHKLSFSGTLREKYIFLQVDSFKS